MAIVVEPLGKHHDRKTFSSGEPALDDWFRLRASQDEKRDIARVFVATDDEFGVVGFYSLSAFTLATDAWPDSIARKLPRYDAIPAALIGRLARDERGRGRGLGELLLADAIRRVLAAARSIAVFAIIVDSKNDAATRFYEAFGFRPFPLRPERLFMLASVAAAALEASSRS